MHAARQQCGSSVAAVWQQADLLSVGQTGSQPLLDFACCNSSTLCLMLWSAVPLCIAWQCQTLLVTMARLVSVAAPCTSHCLLAAQVPQLLGGVCCVMCLCRCTFAEPKVSAALHTATVLSKLIHGLHTMVLPAQQQQKQQRACLLNLLAQLDSHMKKLQPPPAWKAALSACDKHLGQKPSSNFVKGKPCQPSSCGPVLSHQGWSLLLMACSCTVAASTGDKAGLGITCSAQSWRGSRGVADSRAVRMGLVCYHMANSAPRRCRCTT
jgi:hypothetical protein